MDVSTNSSTTASVKMDYLVAKMRDRQEDQDREVFVFPGTLGEFLAAMREAGIREESGSSAIRDRLCGIKVEEVGGQVICGTPEALRRFRRFASVGGVLGGMVIPTDEHYENPGPIGTRLR